MISQGPDSGIYAMLRQAMLKIVRIKEKIRKNFRVGIFIKQHMGFARAKIGQYIHLCLRKSLFFKVKRATSPGQLKRTGTPDVPTPGCP